MLIAAPAKRWLLLSFESFLVLGMELSAELMETRLGYVISAIDASKLYRRWKSFPAGLSPPYSNGGRSPRDHLDVGRPPSSAIMDLRCHHASSQSGPAAERMRGWFA
jgi:hypothetical protein